MSLVSRLPQYLLSDRQNEEAIWDEFTHLMHAMLTGADAVASNFAIVQRRLWMDGYFFDFEMGNVEGTKSAHVGHPSFKRAA